MVPILMPAGTTLADVNPHGFNNAGLGLFDGLPKTVDAWKVVAVGVVLAAFALDRDRIGVEFRRLNLPTNPSPGPLRLVKTPAAGHPLPSGEGGFYKFNAHQE